MKIVAINITFREERFYRRWRLLAREFGHEVTLVGPRYYEYHKFGDRLQFKPSPISEEGFSVFHVNMKRRRLLRNDWFSFRYLEILINKRPDVIYLIGNEANNAVIISIIYKCVFNQNVKLVMFTMRGTDMPLKQLEYRLRWKLCKVYFDLIQVHYPAGRDVIKVQGKFTGPINLQTQIGVDRDIFFPCKEYRRVIRAKYGIEDDEFVFGVAGRIEAAKGVFRIIEACHLLQFPFKLFLLGDGDDFSMVQRQVLEGSLRSKIILTGRIPNGEQVNMYMNAMDCFVHFPLTTLSWVDTFPLAVIQAMACSLPVIGSDSGAVPYQIGDKNMIVSEGNSCELARKMTEVYDNRRGLNKIGESMLKRALSCFEIRHLNKCLDRTFNALVAGNNEEVALDQTAVYEPNMKK